MGCDNEILAASENPPAAREAMEAAAREVLRIEHKYSRYRTDAGSVVHRINTSAGGEPVAIDDETLRLLDFAHSLNKQSGSLFDITSGVLRRVWDFKRPVLPSQHALAEVLKLIGWERVERDGNAIRLPAPGMEIDFGGIGKEYAADRAAEVLGAKGVRHGYVNLGGDIRAIGGDPEGKPWLIGVQNPDKLGTVIATVPLINEGLATSGDYEKFVTISGRRYCHIINPKTGFPVSCWRSVSVVGVSALLAGALATIAMLKEQDAPEFLRSMRCGFLLIDADGQVTRN